jgi:hypothetical protein
MVRPLREAALDRSSPAARARSFAAYTAWVLAWGERIVQEWTGAPRQLAAVARTRADRAAVLDHGRRTNDASLVSRAVLLSVRLEPDPSVPALVDQALAMDPPPPHRARLLLLRGENAEHLDDLDAAAELAAAQIPEDPQLLSGIARARALHAFGCSDIARALDLAREAVLQAPSTSSAPERRSRILALHTLAMILSGGRRWVEADATLSEALALGPEPLDEVRILAMCALIQLDSSEVELGAATCLRALERLGEDGPMIRRRLEVLLAAAWVSLRAPEVDALLRRLLPDATGVYQVQLTALSAIPALDRDRIDDADAMCFDAAALASRQGRPRFDRQGALIQCVAAEFRGRPDLALRRLELAAPLPSGAVAGDDVETRIQGRRAVLLSALGRVVEPERACAALAEHLAADLAPHDRGARIRERRCTSHQLQDASRRASSPSPPRPTGEQRGGAEARRRDRWPRRPSRRRCEVS